MLGSIRKKTKGWIAYTIIGLIIIPFALFGIAEYSTGVANVVVATIDDDEISKNEFLSKFEQQKRRLQEEMGEKYTIEFDNKLKYLTIQSLVRQNLLNRLAEELGYVTTTEELQEIVQSNDNFKVDGSFSLDRYRQLLRLNGYSDVAYEAEQLTKLTQLQIRQNLLNSAFISASSLKQIQELNEQQRKFSYVRLNTNDYIKQVKVKQQHIQDFYNEKKESFFEPEQVKLDFVELSLAEIAKDIEVSDEALFDFYQEQKERFSTEEERQAQHILLAEQATANKVLDLLNSGGDFTKLAAEYSKDAASKDNAGDLGFFTRGVMVAEFENKVFSMNPGELSDLVKSEFGYHIIKLNKIEPAKIKSFDEAKSELSESYTEQQAIKELYGLSEQLANLAYESTLEEVANQMNLKLQTTEFFDRDNSKINQKMRSAAFSDVVLNKGENSQVLELSKDKIAVVRLQQKLPQRQKDFAEVQAEIKANLVALAAKKFVNKTVNNIVTLLKKGDDNGVKQIMQQHKLKWQQLGWVGRTANQAPAEIMAKVFTLPKPSADNSVYSVGDIDENYSVAIQLSGVKTVAAEVPNLDLKNSLLKLEADEIFDAILTTLHKNSDLKIFAEQL